MIMAQSHDRVSENTEMSVISDSDWLSHFVCTVSWGTVVGTMALISQALPSLANHFDLAALLGALLFFGFVVSIFTCGGMLLIGLPITLVLRAFGHEHAWLYAALGTIAGFLVLAVLGSGSSADSSITVSGAIAGFAAALRWGLWRERRAAIRRQKRASRTSDKRNNPIHDLIH